MTFYHQWSLVGIYHQSIWPALLLALAMDRAIPGPSQRHPHLPAVLLGRSNMALLMHVGERRDAARDVKRSETQVK